MYRLIKPIFWTFLFLAMMLVIDQILVQVPPVHPAHAVVSNFYRDFRGRLIDLAFNEQKRAPKSIEAVIEKQQKRQTDKPGKINKPTQLKTPSAKTKRPDQKQRYLYSDDKGGLHFTDSLDEVPAQYRANAQPMGK